MDGYHMYAKMKILNTFCFDYYVKRVWKNIDIIRATIEIFIFLYCSVNEQEHCHTPNLKRIKPLLEHYFKSAS